MIPNDQPHRGYTIERMINHLSLPNNFDNLTSWEQEFIASIRTQFEAKGNLSQKQGEILDRIYDK